MRVAALTRERLSRLRACARALVRLPRPELVSSNAQYVAFRYGEALGLFEPIYSQLEDALRRQHSHPVFALTSWVHA